MATTESTQILDQQVGVKIVDRSAAFSISYGIMFAALVAYCVIGAATVVTGGAQMLTNPWDNTLPEGAHVYAAIRAAQTGHLYFPYTQSPYVVQSYGPLFYAINAAIARASHMDVWRMLVRGRLFCFLCYLFCGVFVFAISRKTGATLAVSILAPLMMLGHPDFAHWSVTVRPDVPFLLAMLISLYFAVRDESSGSYLIALSGLFAGFAFLIKQPGIAAAIAIFGVLAWDKQYRKAIIFAVAAAAPVAAAFALLLWRESSFLGQVTSVGKATWSLREGIHLLFRTFIADQNNLIRDVPFCIGILGLINAAKQKGSRRMIACFAVANWVVQLSGVSQLGATTNYYMPGWAGFALLLPEAVEFAREKARSTFSAPRFTAAMLITSALLLWSARLGYLTVRSNEGFYRAPGNVSYEPLRPYRIISDRSVLALYGHDPDLLDNFAVHSLELNNLWSSAPLVDDIRREKYDLILLLRVNYKHVATNYRGVSEYSPDVLAAINEKYGVLCSTMMSIILKPRDRDVPLTAEYFGRMLDVRCGTASYNKSPKLTMEQDSR